ncbi:HD-GYP domain-containing protein [Bacillus sp. AK128]
MLNFLRKDVRVKNLLLILKDKDLATYRHSVRVASIIDFIAKEWKLADRELIARSALLHDVGKLKIPSTILLKNSKLDGDEWNYIMNHSLDSIDILRMQFEPNEIDYEMVKHHHENEDGTGYPSRLTSESISFHAKLIRIIDSYEAMTGYRPYRNPLTKDEAIHELSKYSGTYYDDKMLKRFIETVNKKDLVDTK